MARRSLLLLLLIVAAAACAPTAQTTVPTLTLIPATDTPTATAVPPTSTPANLPGPQDVLGPTATVTITSSAPGSLTGSDLVTQDPVAGELVGIAQRLVANERDLPTNRIFLVDARPVVWTDSTLNCAAPNSDIVQQETDGYRIVLHAGDQDYLFHTDVDRVVPCDPANEKLPPSVVLPTPEVTAEATQAS